MNQTKQADLAKLFNRSTSWVCKMQKRQGDPMPTDLQGATDWGVRNRLISAQGATPLLDAPAAPGPLEQKDIELKDARIDKLRMELARENLRLLPREEVEAREIQAAVEFRFVACGYPLRARAVIERFVSDPAAVESIVAGLQPLAADMLNKADPRQVLKGRPVEEVRAALLARVEELLKCL